MAPLLSVCEDGRVQRVREKPVSASLNAIPVAPLGAAVMVIEVLTLHNREGLTVVVVVVVVVVSLAEMTVVLEMQRTNLRQLGLESWLKQGSRTKHEGAASVTAPVGLAVHAFC